MATTIQPAENELAKAVAEFYADPLGFILFAYPWGEPGELENESGPDDMSLSLLDEGRHHRTRIAVTAT